MQRVSIDCSLRRRTDQPTDRRTDRQQTDRQREDGVHVRSIPTPPAACGDDLPNGACACATATLSRRHFRRLAHLGTGTCRRSRPCPCPCSRRRREGGRRADQGAGHQMGPTTTCQLTSCRTLDHDDNEAYDDDADDDEAARGMLLAKLSGTASHVQTPRGDWPAAIAREEAYCTCLVGLASPGHCRVLFFFGRARLDRLSSIASSAQLRSRH
jgi:hypothetical protein